MNRHFAIIDDAFARAADRRAWLGWLAVSAAADLGLIYALMVALRQQRAGLGDTRELLLYGFLVAAWFIAGRRVRRMSHRHFASLAEDAVREALYRLDALPLDRFEQLERGAILARLMNDSDRVASAGTVMIAMGHAIIRLMLGALFVLAIAPRMAAPAALALALIGVGAAAQSGAMRRAWTRVAEDESRLYAGVQARIDAAVPLKLHAARARSVAGAFDRLSASMRRLRVDVFTAFFVRQHAATGLLYAILGLNILILPLFLVVDTESIRDVNLVLVRIVFSVFGLAVALPDVGLAHDAYARVASLAPEMPSALPPMSGPSATGLETLRLERVAFAYPASADRAGFVLGPIDLTMRKGEVIFLVGDNGGGKSTLLKVLTGLYPARAGQIVVDGLPVDEAERGPYRHLFSPIFTRHHIFERVEGLDAAGHARAARLLDEMDIGEATRIVDGRITRRALSTGQKKRLAMVVARLNDRPVMVFDEWAADQDPEYRALFYERLLPELKAEGRIVIVASHDERYFDCADRIVRVHQGQIRHVPHPARGA